MKNFMKIAVIWCAFATLLFSCGDATDENVSKNSNGNGNNNTPSNYDMTGNYTFTVNNQECTWIFKSDGNYEVSGPAITGTKTGTWSAKGNDITISYATSGGGAVSGIEVFTVQGSGDQVTLAIKDNSAQVSLLLVSLGLAAKSVVLTTKTGNGNGNVSYTVTFDKNGGDTEASPTTKSGGASGVGALPSEPTKVGYTFAGWYTVSAETGGTQFTATTAVTQAVTVYARWWSIPIPIEMVYVAGGSFQMGKELRPAEYYDDVTPVHTVTLTGFYMGKYEVTQAQYQAVMGSNPSYFHGGSGREPASGEAQGNRPVEKVSWYDALVFCNKLSMAERLSPAYSISGSTDPAAWGTVPTTSNSTWDAAQIVSGANGYRLPTEAQWEYAAKGGNGSPGNYTYSGSNTAGDVAWYDDNCNSMTHEVGKKSPNGLGIYDMSGNVFEWCWDWYGSYKYEAQSDPTGAVSGALRVRRGGGWGSSAEFVRSAFRYFDYPIDRYESLGFRLVRL